MRVIGAIKAWAPPPRMLVSEWAQQHRYLSPESSAEPGRWLNERAPHLVAPMDALSPYHPAARVVCRFASQTGKTEAILNFVGYIIDLDPGPILVIQPNVQPMGEAFSKDRIAPMLRDCPSLAGKIGPARSRDSASTITHKVFPRGTLTIAGANSPAGLSSRPIRYLLCDEIDRWEATKEGDPLMLGRKRQQTFRAKGSSKELLVSSPTFADVGISSAYDRCQQRHEWQVPCLHCGEYQFPRLKHFESGRYVCEKCGATHDFEQAEKVKARGKWVQTADNGRDSIGFWMNQWASPFARWQDTLEEWRSAQDPLERQVVVNTVFAECWEGEGERVDTHVLAGRAEDYVEPPAEVDKITIGCDLQKDRIEYEVVGWGPMETSWSLEYGAIPGDPTGPELWADLDEVFRRRWDRADGVRLPCSIMCIDSGYWSKNVYAYVASKSDPRIIPVKGASAFGADALSGTWRDRRRREIKRIAHGRPPEIIGVSQIKITITRYLAARKGDQGFCHFPSGRDDEYYRQLTGESLVREKKRGKAPTMAWVRMHTHVEALDCRVYAYAALLMSAPAVKLKPAPKPAVEEAPAKPRRINRTLIR